MFSPATTYVATYLEVADIHGSTVASRPAQRRERLIEPEFNVTWRARAERIQGGTVIPFQPPAFEDTEQTNVDTQVKRLLELSTLPDNWDGCGSAQASGGSIKWARMFLQAISSQSHVPKPTLHANGNALLLYGPDPYAEIEFTEDGRIIYYAQHGEQHVFSEENEIFDGVTIPAKLRALGIV